MKKLLPFLLSVLLLLCGDAFAKSKRQPRKQPRKSEQELRQDLKVQPKKMESDRDLRRNVKHYNSSTWINGIPMYDQGSRPECAVAVIRRLLDYYATKNQVNMNALRQALGYDKSTGTEINQMVKAIQKYSPQLRLNFQPIYSYMETTLNIKEALTQYNKYTTSKNQVIDVPKEISPTDGFQPFVKNIHFQAWQKMRCTEQKREQQNAWKQITRQIDQGIPVVWGVTLGLAQEQGNKQKVGGHLRLIIGYDASKGRILYSDSWGAGHEKKEMLWDVAWAITQHLFVLSPRN